MKMDISHSCPPEGGNGGGISQDTLSRSIAYKKYLEHFYEDYFKLIEQRNLRKYRLEKYAEEHKFTDKQKRDARKQLYKKETEYMRLRRAKISVSQFDVIKVIGRGAFGEVSLVQKKDTNEIYAMKKMKKHEMIKSNQVAHVRAERDLMAANKYIYKDNPWIVDLVYSFIDEDYLYLIMEYVPGGDLMTLLIKRGTLKEDEARFYLAETVLAVDSVHKLDYIHRDIKPDNLLVDASGHLKLSDFGLCLGQKQRPNNTYVNQLENLRHLALNKSHELDRSPSHPKNAALSPSDERELLASWKQVRRELAHSTVGTPDYIAPEALLQRGYHQGSDWWSVGIIFYEMLFGFPPFCSEVPSETYRKILNYKTSLQFPFHTVISPEAFDLINKLVCDESERLGVGEIKAHPFFKGIQWDTLREQRPCYVPHISGPTDTSNFDCFEEDTQRRSSIHKEDSRKSTNSEQAIENYDTGDNLEMGVVTGELNLPTFNKLPFSPAFPGAVSVCTTPRTSTYQEKLEKRYSVHDMHFAGYAFQSFDAVNMDPINEDEEILPLEIADLRRKTRPRSTTF